MTDRDHRSQTQLFTLRIWAETVGEQRVEWRGKLKHIPTGESLYFRRWEQLIGQLKRFLEQIPES